MENTTHPHTSYWLQVNLGLDQEPKWWPKRKQLIEAVHSLWALRQQCYYEGTDQSQYRDRRRQISKGFKIKFETIDLLLGIATTDPVNAYGAVRDFFLGADPKLRRTRKVVESTCEWSSQC
tara:strand:- start:1210 stop:1572 length:363 start_codon:yes stop_codon:yes gene_type:complete